MQLRSYQREAIDALYDYFQENDGNPLLVLPTAAGKSVIIGAFIRELMERWPGQRVLMLTHVKELIAQNARKLATLWPEAPWAFIPPVSIAVISGTRSFLPASSRCTRKRGSLAGSIWS